VRTSPFSLVDAAFAWDEGEGDRSLAWWQRAHRDFFQRQCERAGVPFSEDLPVVLERFELVWPAPPDSERSGAGPDRSHAPHGGCGAPPPVGRTMR
jgi:hypothetical protein